MAGHSPRRTSLSSHATPSSPGRRQLDLLARLPRPKCTDIPCTVISATNPIAIDVPAVQGKLSGSLAANTIDATWTQGSPLPITLDRQTAAAKPTPPPQPDAALPPADANPFRPSSTKISPPPSPPAHSHPPRTQASPSASFSHGQRSIFTYGTAKPDSVFEIGSITKTFTGLILAQMVEQKSVRLTDPVRELLPPGTVAEPASGLEITLLDLSDQHSGLPRMPDNFAPADHTNPYADYDTKLLYAYIAKHGVALTSTAPFEYSNLGVGLLGAALANRAGLSYNDLLHLQITGPLNMTDTAITLTPSMRARFIEGHDGAHNPAHAWDLDALAGAGGIRSTAADMLTYLEAQLHPDKLPATAASTPQGKTLPAAINASHTSTPKQRPAPTSPSTGSTSTQPATSGTTAEPAATVPTPSSTPSKTSPSSSSSTPAPAKTPSPTNSASTSDNGSPAYPPSLSHHRSLTPHSQGRVPSVLFFTPTDKGVTTGVAAPMTSTT